VSLSIDRLGRDRLPEIDRLCRRGVADAPSLDELEGALFAPDQPAAVLGDPDVGVVAVVDCDDGPHVRLLVVDPSRRGRGHGTALLREAEDWATRAGHRSLVIGADPPYFLWPGVPGTETALLCLLERRHYVRTDTNFNMRIGLGSIPPDPGGHSLATADERAEIDGWMTTHWSNWRPEVLRALDEGNLVLAREADDPGDVTAFCAFEVNRRGLLGPVAVRPDLMGRGRGRGVLLGALHELRRRGLDEVSVVWVGPVVPYASVGGTVAEVFFVYRRELR
jgi:GNAT superfamily N-acetyltransferase